MARTPTAAVRSIAILLLLAAGCEVEPPGEPAQREGAPPAAAAEARRQPQQQTSASRDGHYQVSIRPEPSSAPLNRIHAWQVETADASGEPLDPTRLAVSGGMPQHGHGFVTQPRVTRRLGPGRYRIDGVKFHMGGDWTLRIELVGPAGPDVASFVVTVGP